MRFCCFVLAGLLALHGEALPAAKADASLTVSATVSSVCAMSSRPFDGVERRAAGGSGPARVDCAPAAAYAISLDSQVRDLDPARRIEPPASTRVIPPAGRQNGVLVVEISY